MFNIIFENLPTVIHFKKNKKNVKLGSGFLDISIERSPSISMKIKIKSENFTYVESQKDIFLKNFYGIEPPKLLIKIKPSKEYEFNLKLNGIFLIKEYSQDDLILISNGKIDIDFEIEKSLQHLFLIYKKFSELL